MHKYSVTIWELFEDGSTEPDGNTIRFEVENHDDILQIIEVVQSKRVVGHDKAAALVTGLKLLGEVVLENRHHPLFAPLSEPLRSFIRELKQIPVPEHI